jgi:predicted adenine nucleotide alpha hydrolase (AANH) superfamily ATPase
VARVDDIALVDMPADERGPRCINCYFVKVEDAAAIAADAKKFKIDPLGLLCSLR